MLDGKQGAELEGRSLFLDHVVKRDSKSPRGRGAMGARGRGGRGGSGGGSSGGN